MLALAPLQSMLALTHAYAQAAACGRAAAAAAVVQPPLLNITALAGLAAGTETVGTAMRTVALVKCWVGLALTRKVRVRTAIIVVRARLRTVISIVMASMTRGCMMWGVSVVRGSVTMAMAMTMASLIGRRAQLATPLLPCALPVEWHHLQVQAQVPLSA